MKSAGAWLLPLLLLVACGGDDEPSGYLGAPTEVWAERLRSPDPGARDAAIRQLGEMRADVVPVLRSLLTHSDRRVHTGAQESVARILQVGREGDPARLEPFLPLFADLARSPHQEWRELGFRAFRTLGPSALPALAAVRPWLTQHQPQLALAAAETVLAVAPGDPAAVRAVLPALLTPGTREAAGKILDAHAERAVPVLIESLRATDVHVRDGARLGISMLAGKAASAKPALLAMLGTEDDALRCDVARTLAIVDPGNADALDALEGLLRDSVQVRQAAANALAGLGKPGMDALRAALSAESPVARVFAAGNLVLLEPKPDRPAGVLVDVLGGDDPVAARYAYAILYELCERSAPAVPALIRLLASGSPSQQTDAADLLGRIGPPARTALPALRRLLATENEDLRDTVELSIAKIEAD